MRHDNELKLNGILFWSKDDDWGRKAAAADKKVLFSEETASKQKDFELQGTDFHLEAYVYGTDAKSKIAQLNNLFNTGKNLILEHPVLGKVRVKFQESGFRFKRNEKKLDYYDMVLDLINANDAALNIKVVEVQELKSEQLKELEVQSAQSFLESFDENFTFEGFPNLVKMQTFDNLTSITGKLSKLTADNLIGDITNPIAGSWDILAISAGGIGSFLQSYLDFGGNNKNKYHAYMDVAKFNPDFKNADVHPQIAINTDASVNILKQTAIIKACELVEADVFDNKKEVNTAIDDLIATSETIALQADNKKVQNNLLQTVHLAILCLKDLKVNNTNTIVNKIQLPAAVICHNYRCSEEDFVKNNAIRHPLFVASGVALEVSNERN